MVLGKMYLKGIVMMRFKGRFLMPLNYFVLLIFTSARSPFSDTCIHIINPISGVIITCITPLTPVHAAIQL